MHMVISTLQIGETKARAAGWCAHWLFQHLGGISKRTNTVSQLVSRAWHRVMNGHISTPRPAKSVSKTKIKV